MDCLFVSETKLNNSHLDSCFKVPEYTMYRRDNPRDRGGGLVCFIRSDVPSYCIKPDSGPIETLQVNCVLNREKWSFLCVYKKPKVSPLTINQELDSVIDRNMVSCDKYLILGDMNCNMLNTSGNAVHKLCENFNLTQVIKEPTCFKGENPTLIDVMLFSEKRSCLKTSVYPCPLSDFHHFINGVIRVNMPRTTTRKVIYRSYKHFDSQAFGSELREAPFHVGEILNVDSHMEFFQDLFLSVLDRHAPLKCKTIRTRQCPHMTPEWKSTIYSRNMAYNTYRKNKCKQTWEKYRKLRNKCVKLSKIALKQYFNDKCTTKAGPSKEFWQTVKPYFSKRCNSSETIQLDVNGKILADPLDVAEAFNAHYLSIASQIGVNSIYSNNISNHPSLQTIETYSSDKNLPTFDFHEIGLEDIHDIIGSLPTGKAPGYDGISTKCVKPVKDTISAPLLCIVNRMFIERTFPDCLKDADVSPIYKKAHKLLAPNYRPVSVLITFSKIFELAISNQLDPQLTLLYSIYISAYRKSVVAP